MANKFGTARILGDLTAQITPQEKVNLEMLRAVESLGRRLERTENERDRLAARLAQIEAAGSIDEKTGKFYLPVVIDPHVPKAAHVPPRWAVGVSLMSSALAILALGISLYRTPEPQVQLTPQQLAALNALAGPLRTVDATGNGWKKIDEVEGVEAKTDMADNMPPQPEASKHEDVKVAALPSHNWHEAFGPTQPPAAKASDGWRVAAEHTVAPEMPKVAEAAPADQEVAEVPAVAPAPEKPAVAEKAVPAPEAPAPKLAAAKKEVAPEDLTAPPDADETAEAPAVKKNAEKSEAKAEQSPVPFTAAKDDERPSDGLAIGPDPALSPQLAALEKRAFSGSPEAQHDLATIYAAGKSVAQDYKRAAYWFYKAADGGIANADYNLGVMFQEGMGVHKDVNKALGWYEKAAQLGHPEAMYNLGIAYVEGVGTARNIDRGVSYFKKAANAGVAQAAYNLGVLYESNFVGPINLAKAQEWYQVAADQGHAQAKDAVARLRQQIASATKTGEQGAKVASQVEPAAGSKDDAEYGEGDASPVGDDHADPLLLARVQSALIAHGDLTGSASGVMDEKTSDAIHAWQKKLGLPPTGQPTLQLLQGIRDANSSK